MLPVVYTAAAPLLLPTMLDSGRLRFRAKERNGRRDAPAGPWRGEDEARREKRTREWSPAAGVMPRESITAAGCAARCRAEARKNRVLTKWLLTNLINTKDVQEVPSALGWP